MKTLNRILIGTVLLATLFSCQDVVTYNDGYDDGMNSFEHLMCRASILRMIRIYRFR